MSDIGSQLNCSISNSPGDLLLLSACKMELEAIIEKLIVPILVPVLEPLIRRAVREQIELAQELIMTRMNNASGERPSSSHQRRLKLRFRNNVQGIVLTGKHIYGEDNCDLTIELIDASTNLIVKLGPEASARVKIVLLRVDPDGNNSNEREWTSEKFNEMIVRESPLIGNMDLQLYQGSGTVGKLHFPHTEKWTRKCEYMLGAKLEQVFDGINVTEAKSSVFQLRDSRNIYYEKKYPPNLGDKVFHLINIGKGGTVRLIGENIVTVKDFLKEYFKNHRSLSKILKMPEQKLNDTIAHALTCKELEDKYVYYIPGSQQQMGIVFNVVGQLFGQIFNRHFSPMNCMSDTHKDNAKILVAYALQHWEDVVRYNKHSFSNTSNANSTFSDISFENSKYDTSNDNFGNHEVQALTVPMDITSSYNTFHYPFEINIDGTNSSTFNISNVDGLLDGIPDIWMLDPDFSIQDYVGQSENC